MDDEKLIECVRKYELLYNLQHPKYMDSAKKDIAWKDISDQMKQPASACKQRWQGLRDAFRRVLKRKKGTRGQAAKHYKKWKYEDEMLYLIPFFVERKTLDSVGVTSDEEYESYTQEIDSIPTDNCNISSEINSSSVVDPAVDAATSITDLGNAVTERPIKKAKKKNRIQREQSALASLMAKLLEEQNRELQQDELDRFFLTISSTVKKFSPYQQAVAKSKIFNLVSEMELQQLAPLTCTPCHQYVYTPSPQSTTSQSATPVPGSPN